MTQEVGIKKLSKTWPRYTFFYECGSYRIYENLESLTTKIPIPDTTGV